LIDSARGRFYNDGFRSVGIDSIYGDVGISKPAFYKHFESKDALMVAVLEDVGVFIGKRFQEMVVEIGGPSAVAQLRAIMDVVEKFIEGDEFHGCFFVKAAMEFPLPHDPVHQLALHHKRAMEEFICSLAERAHAKDPTSMAEEFCLILEGCYVTRSVTNNPQTIAIARRMVDQLLERHLPVAVGSVRSAATTRTSSRATRTA
jgi:AcrR family transcriptional regulator